LPAPEKRIAAAEPVDGGDLARLESHVESLIGELDRLVSKAAT
jgi:hypothetical protein